MQILCVTHQIFFVESFIAHAFDRNYLQTPNISRTLVGKENVAHSDVVRASPVGAAPTTSSFLT